MSALVAVLAWSLLAGPLAAPLAGSPSPFLRERAADPVAWMEWGEPAFARARSEGRLVLVVVGRAPSDRCRSRLVEALVDPVVRDALARRFVPVLVDGDERPDLVDAAQQALGLLGKNETGIPVALVLTPDVRPAAGESLAPPAPDLRLRALLTRSGEDWAARRREVETHAGLTAAALREAQKPGGARDAPGREAVDRARSGLRESFDVRPGGFGAAPRPIPHGALGLLLAEHARSGDVEALRMAVSTLDAIVRGALRDPATGAFHSLALDDRWRVADSATTLADNALLIRALTLAHRAGGQPAFRDAAGRVADWALSRMTDPAGGFQAATWRGGDGAESRDPRVFTGANGLMIGALAMAGEQLHRPGDLAAARTAAASVLERLFPQRTLHRYALDGQARGAAFLEDHAYLAEGLLDLAEATREIRWQQAAQAVTDAALARFADPHGTGFFDVDDAAGLLLVRTRNGFDGGLPAANAVLASVLRRLAAMTGETRYADLARGTVLAFASELRQAPRGMETMAEAVAGLLGPASAPTPGVAPLPARAERGAVALEAGCTPARGAAGAVVLGRVRLRIAEGWRVNAHRPGPKDLAGLAVSVPGPTLASGTPRYPTAVAYRRRFGSEEAAVHTGEAEVTVPMRIRADQRPGRLPVRFRVVFQACHTDECRAPESVLLEVPFEVTR